MENVANLRTLVDIKKHSIEYVANKGIYRPKKALTQIKGI